MRERIAKAAALLEKAGIEDALFDARILVQLAANDDEKLAALLAKRAAHYPLQYLCNDWDFLDFTLQIGEGVLIPRADTEIVAETGIAAAKAVACPTVVDLCSGSGAIAIALARSVPSAKVTAVELSPEALLYLRQNVAALAPHITVVQADVFEYQTALAAQSIDVLVSNPPYITHEEMGALAPELSHEPRMALEAGDNGLLFYKHIAKAYRSALKKGGVLVFEIGATQSESVHAILRSEGYQSIETIQDYGGNNRCVRCVAF